MFAWIATLQPLLILDCCFPIAVVAIGLFARPRLVSLTTAAVVTAISGSIICWLIVAQ